MSSKNTLLSYKTYLWFLGQGQLVIGSVGSCLSNQFSREISNYYFHYILWPVYVMQVLQTVSASFPNRYFVSLLDEDPKAKVLLSLNYRKFNSRY